MNDLKDFVCLTSHCKCNSKCDDCSECENEIDNWLEEHDKQIRADAIEECCKQISERVNYWDNCAKAVERESNEYKIFISLAKNFDELAEQLKGGRE